MAKREGAILCCGEAALVNRLGTGSIDSARPSRRLVLVALASRVCCCAPGSWSPGRLSADEAIPGLMPRHILSVRELPVFYRGQDYFGALESYFVAALFAVLGFHPWLVFVPALLASVALIPLVWTVAEYLAPAPAGAIAAHMLEVAPDDVELVEGSIQVKGAPGKSITFAAVAREAYNGVKLPDGMEPGLQFTRVFDPPNFTFPGNVVNPRLVNGQMQGGVAQGAAQAFWEEVTYDNETGQLVSGSLGDYAAVRADGLPMTENHRTVTVTPSNPLGTKGIGEAGTIGSAPTVANAVGDALRQLGIKHVDIPATAERSWKLIQSATNGPT